MNSETMLSILFMIGLVTLISSIAAELMTHHEAYLVLSVLGAAIALSVTWFGVWQEKETKD